MRNFDRSEAVAVLERTPHALRALLGGLPDAWLSCDEGPETFSPREVLGHLVHGERVDWLVRTRVIMEHGTARSFDPYDRFAQRTTLADVPPRELLDLFERLRRENLAELAALVRVEADLDRHGLHPALGEVTLRQLLASWVVHDLTHIAQIARVMARRYADDVGPWTEYMGVLQWRLT